MNEPEQAIRHHDDPDLFRAALTYTAAKTGFNERLVEKDYFCTLLLCYLAETRTDIAFKGGTCLAKVHVNFYRMSEDLDFAISSPCNASRKERRLRIASLKQRIDELPESLPVFCINRPLSGANDSKQYLADIGYTSPNTGRMETIKLEVSLREPLLISTSLEDARTILLNPITTKPFVAPVAISCLSLLESFAEKYRAALSRREPAIRDFFDIDYAKRKLGIDARQSALLELTLKKMAIPGNGPVDVSAGRLIALSRQIDTQLKPVLKKKDFEEFDLDQSFGIVRDVADLVADKT